MKKLAWLFLVIIVITVVACQPQVHQEQPIVVQEEPEQPFEPVADVDSAPKPVEEPTTPTTAPTQSVISGGLPAWMNVELTDVTSGEIFTIGQHVGKPILLESFAVWCPKCTSQQKEIKKFHEQVGDAFVSISLDTDPNEDEAKVRSHVERNGFEDSLYAILPTDLTQSLIDEFGIGFVNAPSVPLVLICPDGSYERLKSGQKSISYLQGEIDNC